MFDKCSQSIPLFLMINWCFIAFSDADQKDKKKQGKIKKTEEVFIVRLIRKANRVGHDQRVV